MRVSPNCTQPGDFHTELYTKLRWFNLKGQSDFKHDNVIEYKNQTYAMVLHLLR